MDKTVINCIKSYAVNNGLEVVFPIGHRYYGVVFYDRLEGKYYNRHQDLFIPDEQLKIYNLI